MKFSTKTRYALRLMIDLARNRNDEYMSLREVSEHQDISVKYLEQIVAQLTRAGLLRSSRGPQGGYRLAKDASLYTPGEIVRAIEGNLSVVACLDCEPNVCTRADACPTLAFWEGLNKTINDYLDSMTLEEMAESYR